MKYAGFIIAQWSFHIGSMPFTLQLNDVFYSHNSFYKVCLTALNNLKLKWIVYGNLY